jgi:hypothetical protein
MTLALAFGAVVFLTMATILALVSIELWICKLQIGYLEDVVVELQLETGRAVKLSERANQERRMWQTKWKEAVLRLPPQNKEMVG